MIDNLKTTLFGALQDMRAAAAAYERERAKLHTSDGEPLFAPDVMRERLQELRAPLDNAHEQARSEVEAVRDKLGDVMALAQHPDPLADVSSVYYDEVRVRQALISEDAQALPLDELAGAVVAAVLRGNDIEVKLWQRYAERRYRDVMAAVRAGQDAPDGLPQLRRALDRLPQTDTTAADELRTRTTEATIEVSRLYSEATGEGEDARQRQAAQTVGQF
jgi:hypothetical protein